MNQGAAKSPPKPSELPVPEELEDDRDPTVPTYSKWRKDFILNRLRLVARIVPGSLIGITIVEAVFSPEMFSDGLWVVRLASIVGLLLCWGLQKIPLFRLYPSLPILCNSMCVTLLPQILRSFMGLVEFDPFVWSLMFFSLATCIPVLWQVHLQSQLVPLIYFGVTYGILRLPLSKSSTAVSALACLYLLLSVIICYALISLYDRLARSEFAARREIEVLHQHIEKISVVDSLTGIANRRRFSEHLSQEWRRMARENKPLSLILCRIDFFKRYSYICGETAANECMQQVATGIRQAVKRPADLVARYRGDTFGIILPNTNAEGATKVARMIRAEVDALKIIHPDSQISSYITVSQGVSSTIPQRDVTEITLMIAAGEAWSEAKANGGDSIILKSLDRQKESSQPDEMFSSDTVG